MAEPEESMTWGTLEELLLACAVNRYGTKCWDSVAREIQKRSSTFRSLTPQNCQQKYNDLKRRFNSLTQTPPPHSATAAAQTDSYGGAAAVQGDQLSLWLDELRRLRIAELKRELKRYDLSIVSLQLKVQKLKEEQEMSLKENGKEGALDPPRNQEKQRKEEEDDRKEEGGDVPEIATPSPDAGLTKPLFGEQPGRDIESASCNETVEPAAPPPEEAEMAAASRKIQAGEDSCNGSSDCLAVAATKERAGLQDRDLAEPDHADNSPKLVESVAKPRGRGAEEDDRPVKQRSDGQSSARPSRKKGRVKLVAGNNCIGGEEPDGDNPPLAVGSADAKSQPLFDFLEVIRSHKPGLVFEHRLESQRTSRYKNLIRQHRDLATIRAKLEEGHYSGYHPKFYHDLLLLTTNATTFFPKGSFEYKAALDLQQLIRKNFSCSKLLSCPIRDAEATPPLDINVKPDQERYPSSYSLLLKKPNVVGSVVASRKRSSVVAKSAVGIMTLGDEKAKAEKKKGKPDSLNVITTKKRTRDQRSDSRSSNAKTGATTTAKSSSDGLGRGGSGLMKDDSEPGQEKKKSHNGNINSKKATTTGERGKKGSVASFLNRIRRSSLSDSNHSGFLLDSLKIGLNGKRNNNNNSSSKGGGSVQKKESGGKKGKSDGGPNNRGEVSSSRRAASQASKEKKDEGRLKDEEEATRSHIRRPPKRAAALAAVGKRRRGSGGCREAEATLPPLPPPPRKRSRK